jgi:glyoxylase-like metal-dependent hydrolase (beta-lactamase superfamily II)
MSKLELQVFSGQEANVNAYIVRNATHAVVIDSLRNREEAARLADVIRTCGRRLHAIFVTHGHPDHYIGSRTLQEAFPGARILVASAAVKADIIAFSTWMEGIGWLDKQPQMKLLSSGNPQGFDYERHIEVLTDSRLDLPGGGELQIRSDYPPTECGHMTTVWVPELRALITSDLCYHGVHAWAGPGVLREHIANWIRVLGDLEARYTEPDLRVYPGHGRVSDRSLFATMRTYLNDFLAAVDGESSNTLAIERMKRLYPGYAQEEFLLTQSVGFHGPDGRRGRPAG